MTDNYKGFIKKDVARLLDIRASQVQFYTDQKIIVPEISAPAGKGTRRVYSSHNLLQILIAKRLVEHGVPLGDMRWILDGLDAWCKQFKSLAEGPPRKLPAREKDRIKEKGRVGKMLLEVGALDSSSSHDLFIWIHKKGDQTRIGVLPLARGQNSSKVDEEISAETTSLLIINITDLMERVLRL